MENETFTSKCMLEWKFHSNKKRKKGEEEIEGLSFSSNRKPLFNDSLPGPQYQTVYFDLKSKAQAFSVCL